MTHPTWTRINYHVKKAWHDKRNRKHLLAAIYQIRGRMCFVHVSYRIQLIVSPRRSWTLDPELPSGTPIRSETELPAIQRNRIVSVVCALSDLILSTVARLFTNERVILGSTQGRGTSSATLPWLTYGKTTAAAT